MVLDEHFFLAASFAVFVILGLKFVLPNILKSLDGKSQQVADEIASARKMKEEAQKLLTQAEIYLQESLQFAQKVVKDAESESLKTIEAAKKALADEISKKTNATMNRLKVEEESAVRQVKERIIEAAVQNIYANISRDLNDKNHENLISKSTEELAK